LADASISVGVIALLIWQKKFFPKKQLDESHKNLRNPIPRNK
jgi:lipoprotein signal peptidase